MTGRATHPLYAAVLAADAAWSHEVKVEAKRRRMFSGDFRYHPNATLLPSYTTFRAARDAWGAAGFPVVAVMEAA